MTNFIGGQSLASNPRDAFDYLERNQLGVFKTNNLVGPYSPEYIEATPTEPSVEVQAGALAVEATQPDLRSQVL